MFVVLLQTRPNTLQMSPRLHTDSECLMFFPRASEIILPPALFAHYGWRIGKFTAA
jgi:hypothetical protein